VWRVGSSGSHEGGSWFIKSKTSGQLSLKTILIDFETHDIDLKQHEFVYDELVTASY
jgi:hypothetical protein